MSSRALCVWIGDEGGDGVDVGCWRGGGVLQRILGLGFVVVGNGCGVSLRDACMLYGCNVIRDKFVV